MDPVRFHLDENMSVAIAAALRTLGIDVTLTSDRHLLGEPDQSHIELGKSEGRVLVTNDADFLVHAAAQFDHAGIVYCRQRYRSIGDIIRYLVLLHGVYSGDEMRGRVEFVP